MKSFAEINAIKESVNAEKTPFLVTVGLATCGMAAGAAPVLDQIRKIVAENGYSDTVRVKQVGCIGICQHEPVMEVFRGDERYTYVKMTAEKAARVFEEHIKGGKPVEEFMLEEKGQRVPNLMGTTFMKLQKRVAMRNCGVIDPESIDEYLGKDGYQARHKVLFFGRRIAVFSLLGQHLVQLQFPDIAGNRGLRGRISFGDQLSQKLLLPIRRSSSRFRSST